MKCPLSDRVLDAFIAEKLTGWTSRKRGDILFWKDQNGNYQFSQPKYTQDLNACHEAELKIENKEAYGFQLLWANSDPRELAEEGYSRGEIDIDNKEIVKIATATARQRCEAMYAVLVD